MRILARILVLLSMLASGAAVADGIDASARRPWGTVALMPGVGYRIIVPYQVHKDCGDSSGDASKRVCTNPLPPFLDLRVGYPLTPGLSLLLDLRLGLVRDPVTDARQFALAPGLRLWLDREGAVRFFTTVAGVVDTTDHHGVVDRIDLGLRNTNGLMYDVTSNIAAYFQFGETVGLRRWFRFELDAGLGVEARWP
jgi:hypothetical protein